MNLFKLILANFFLFFFLINFLSLIFKKDEIKKFFICVVPIYAINLFLSIYFSEFSLWEISMIFFSIAIITFVTLTNLYRSITLEILFFIYKKRKVKKLDLVKRFDVNKMINKRIKNIYSSKIFTRKHRPSFQGKTLLLLYEYSKKIYKR